MQNSRIRQVPPLRNSRRRSRSRSISESYSSSHSSSVEVLRVTQPIRGSRGNARLQKRFQEKAKISAMITVNKSFAIKRLIHDLEEIKNPDNAVVGVSAAPLDDSMFEWHANIKALANNSYKGCILHLSLKFPQNYPLNPPKVEVLSDFALPHPNILGNYICLDMLEKPSSNNQNFSSWTSAYTVLSLLLQLQSFFFDVEEEYLKKSSTSSRIIKTVKLINESPCTHPECKHKGSSFVYPELPKVDEKAFVLDNEKHRRAVLNELVCFHRKTTFEQNPLGIMIAPLKLPRTGEIKGIVPSMNYLSLKAFTKEKIRTDLLKKRYSHWFPLYFGYKEDQVLYLTTKSLSLLMNDNTKNFTPDLILKVMPKFFSNIVVDIMSEKVHVSCQALKILIHVYRIFLILLKHYPHVKSEIDTIVEKFLENEKNRNKDNTPSLGEFLIFVSLSEKYKIEDVIYQYLDEQLDRQIFWIIQLLPEIEDLLHTNKIDDVKFKVCFKAGIVGNQIILFYYYFIKKILFKDLNGLETFSKNLDSNYGNLLENEIDNHQKVVQKILKVESYSEFYKFLNLPVPTDSEMNERIKVAFKNSLNKGYHGVDSIRFVPNHKEQIKMLLEKFKPIGELCGGDGKLIPAENEIWEKMVKEKFDHIVRLKYKIREENLTPEVVARYNEEVKFDYLTCSETEKKVEKSDKYKTYLFKESSAEESVLSKMDWRKVYLKIYLETFIKYFRYYGDFKELYNILEKVSQEIIHFNLYIYNPKDLKSNFNFLRVILTKLVKIRHLNLHFMDICTLKTIKNLLKGINNFTQSHGVLDNLKIYVDKAAFPYTHKDHNILTIVDKLSTLKVLDMSNCPLDQNASLRIRNHLYYFKSLEKLNLSNCGLNDDMAKEIADGIMKAKALETIFLNKNKLNKGLASLLYNLAFQPNLKCVDFSDNANSDNKETPNALYKLLKMSQSLEILICRNNNYLINNLTDDFFRSIGDNSSLKYLDLSGSGFFTSDSFSKFGRAIAFNSLKKGAVETVILERTGINYSFFCCFVDNMAVSENDHFVWYGCNFDSNIVKDSKEYFEKKFHCSLKHLDLGNNTFNTDVNINDVKQKNKNHLGNLLSISQIESLNFSDCFINKNFVSMIANAISSYNNKLKRLLVSKSKFNGELVKIFIQSLFEIEAKNNNLIVEKSSVSDKKLTTLHKNVGIEVLDLSKNSFGYNGIEAIASFLKVSRTLRVLNIFHNFIGVDGARSLAKALSTNTSLVDLDVGFNRIKNLGFTEIIKAITSNSSSQITHLGLRHNLISNRGKSTETNLSTLFNSSDSKLSDIELSNNLFDEKSIATIHKQFLEAKNKVNLDLFEILYFLLPEKLEKTVWISPLDSTITRMDISKAIEATEKVSIEKDKSHLGIPTFLSLKRPRNKDLASKKKTVMDTGFVEFIHPNSVNRILKMTSTDGFVVAGKKVRVFKAGTKTERKNLERKKGPSDGQTKMKLKRKRVTKWKTDTK